ncbi:NAD(P)-dependent oxidoreductase [Cyanobium sp. CH-040]|uniref:NAD(P)-dependent oxidoreductase n=1 Tax=Cyanobium sp. CH-040 TaxID=2823708 RepID=UPI0020CF8F52|nr:NAD(P)-dependent oxidoreductase [Cyanobium sp. CH-040]MCP9928965.1 NAD(P)-dependent oxidoreductase [Cyanobium sp. CH-040]
MSVALLGTGLLGTAIGQRLLEQGQSLHAWNRHADRLQALTALGASACADPATAVRASDWVITVLSDGPATRSVLERSGLIAADAADAAGGTDTGNGRRRVVLQMGTIAPGESRELARAVTGTGNAYLELPVLGSRPEALTGTLQVMAAGPEPLFQEALPLLRLLGTEPQLLGPVGAALETKLALNQLIASLTHAFSLSLHLVRGSGVEVERFMGLLRASALYAPTFDKKLQRMLENDYSQPNFPTAHLRKDLELFLAAARARGLDTGGLEGLARLLAAAAGGELDDLDYSALHRLTAPGEAGDG